MAKDLKDAVIRSQGTLLADAIGALSVFAILCVGLSLPGLL